MPAHLSTWKTLERTPLFSAGPIKEIAREKVLLPDGHIVPDYYTVVMGDYALVYAVTTDGKVLELTISSTDPAFLGSGVIGSDHIKFCPGGVATCPFGGGTGTGTFSNGSAKKQTCTTALLTLPAIHD